MKKELTQNNFIQTDETNVKSNLHVFRRTYSLLKMTVCNDSNNYQYYLIKHF